MRKRRKARINETNISDPQRTPISLKTDGFTIRLVKVYLPKESDSSENKKKLLYKLLNKACKKRKKNLKNLLLLVISTLRHHWSLKNVITTKIILFLMMIVTGMVPASIHFLSNQLC